MPTAQSFIALDIGTTFIKGAVLDLEQNRLAHIHRQPFPDPVSGLPPQYYEVDPQAVVTAVRMLIADLLPLAPVCGGVVMCGQMGGLVLTNPQGQALSNYISWLDKRVELPDPSGTGSYFETMVRHLSETDWRVLGQEVRAGLPISTLYWLRETGQIPSGTVIPTTLPDFVMANLCQSAPICDPTHAVGAINLETMDWHDDLLSRLGLDYLEWPKIQDFRSPVGSVTVDGIVLPCYATVGDHQCAVAGIAIDFEVLSLNISTGSQASLLTADLMTGNYQTRPFFDGRFLNTVTQIPAGRSINALLRLLHEFAVAQNVDHGDPWPYIIEAVEAVPTTDLDVDLAFFASPVGDQGSLTGIREDNLTVGHLFRASFQQMAKTYFTCALRLSPEQAWQQIVFSGGLAQNLTALRQHILDTFQVDYRLCASTEDTMLGLLSLAMVINGQTSTVAEAGTRLQAM
ncbi:MAG: FGGY family carbohydrate kinase [Chloroflexota bacterium]